MSINSSIH